ncbi:hypothetical protein DFH06DRAFT_1342454 [Mycena polygramma]|nr:hypothetical protein DFH06DRAFT_1342454 [Mycena polygramma]
MSSPEQLRVIFRDVELGVAIPGVVLTVLLLAVIAYLQWNPVSRPHLDRVSFRLLVYALAGNLVLGLTMLPPVDANTPDPACRFLSFLGVFSPVFSASMFCSIAINLQLVLLYGVNGNKMEKYYLIGGLLLTSAFMVPAALAEQLAWYARAGVCIRLKDPSPRVQLRWVIGVQSIPLVSMAIIELFSIIRITAFMVRHAVRRQQLRADGVAFTSSLNSKHPIVQYRSMIIRITLYPLPSCFLSITACVLDVFIIRGAQFPVPLQIFGRSSSIPPSFPGTVLTDWLLDVTLFTLRPFLYAVFAATDPALLHAIRSLNLGVLSQCTTTTDSEQGVTGDSFVLTAVEFSSAVKGSTNKTALAPPDAEPAKAAPEDTAGHVYGKRPPQWEDGSPAETAAERGQGKNRSHWEVPSPIALGTAATAADLDLAGRAQAQEARAGRIAHQI